MARQPHRVFDRESLMRGAYAPNIHVSERTIDSHVRHVRAKLAEAGADALIETVHGVGVRLADSGRPWLICPQRRDPRGGGRAARGSSRLRPLRPRLATILIIVNLAVVLLPLGSIAFLRIYENQLIQETERELIAQAAFIAAAYERRMRWTAASGLRREALYRLGLAFGPCAATHALQVPNASPHRRHARHLTARRCWKSAHWRRARRRTAARSRRRTIRATGRRTRRSISFASPPCRRGPMASLPVRRIRSRPRSARR